MGSNSSPLMMVNILSNEFYSLAEKKVVTLGHSSAGAVPEIGATLKGSSHGWLALFSEPNLEFFLWNPISGERVNLPSVPIPEKLKGKGGYGYVYKVIVSSSSVELAVMTYGPQERLAFCCPRQSSSEWTTIGDSDRYYTDFAYSIRLNRLFCVTAYGEVDRWDLRDPLSPMIDCSNEEDEEGEEEEEDGVEPYYYIVVAEHSNEVFIVVRKALSGREAVVGMRNSPHEVGCQLSNDIYFQTIGFDVYKVVMEGTKMRSSYMEDGSLNGLAMFVGINHSFALPVADYPGLNPDSIYFTDLNQLVSPICTSATKYAYGGNEVGIFNYKNATFDPCYFSNYHVDAITKVTPLPAWYWFTPKSITSKI